MEQNYESIFPEKQVVYAGFWARFAAMIIDAIIVGVIFGILGLLAGTNTFISLIINLASLVAQWLYFAYMESGEGQATIGKKALGIKVTNMHGGRLTFGQATGRFFGKIISGIILLIGYFMMLWDDKSQTLHDKLAGALVIKA